MQPLNATRPRTSRLRRDPAPSRAAYRLHRLWLTPLFRGLLRIGLPVFLVIFGIAVFLSDEGRRDALSQQMSDLRRSIEERPEFMVRLMAIDGASAELGDDIREVVPLDFPISSFDLDLEAMRNTIAGLDAVESATVRLRPGGILQVDVTERLPAVVWRGREDIELLDASGYRVSSVVARAARPDLPLIVGDGADTAVPQALEILAAAAPIAARVRGLVRMGERRWDLVLDRNQRIQLPENDPIAALERVLVLNRTLDLLERDLSVVDMRNPGRPTLRLTAPAVKELRAIKALETGALSQ